MSCRRGRSTPRSSCCARRLPTSLGCWRVRCVRQVRPAGAKAVEPPVAAVGGGGECGEAVWVGGEDIGGKVAIDKRARGGDVLFKKGAGGKAGGGRGDVDVLVVVDARKRGDGCKAHIDANGGIERGGHCDIHMALAQVLGEAARRGEDFAAPEPVDDRARLIAYLSPTPIGTDELARTAGLSVRVVQTTLLELELDGRIERHGSGSVSLVG